MNRPETIYIGIRERQALCMKSEDGKEFSLRRAEKRLREFRVNCETAKKFKWPAPQTA
jgi:hypothetical protein